MNEYALDKIPFKVSLKILHQKEVSGHVFLSRAFGSLGKTQTVMEFLDDTDAFFPFSTENGLIEFIHKKDVLYFSVESTSNIEFFDSFDPVIFTAQAVRIDLRDQTHLAGDWYISKSVKALRPLDELNKDQRHLKVVDESKVYIISIANITKVSLK